MPGNSTNEPSLLDGLRAACAGQFDGPIQVPKGATPVKDSSGATTAFHWTAPTHTVRRRVPLERGVVRRTRVVLPRRTSQGCARPPARRTVSSVATRAGPDDDSGDPEPAGRGDPVGDTSRVLHPPLHEGAVA